MSDPGTPDDRHDRRDPPPGDLRAPTQAVWETLSPEEKERWHDRLLEVAGPEYEMTLEGDWHHRAKTDADETLRAFFGRTGRRLYVSAELMVVYPGERPFIPDLLAVRDVDPHPRTSWMVANERRGLDLVIEIHYAGHWHKDYAENVERYAALGIPEYFVFNCRQPSIRGWRLPTPDARAYERVHPDAGRFPSHVLGLDLTVENDRLRFYHGTALLLTPAELTTRLEQMLTTMQAAEAEQARAEAERARADSAAGKLAEALLLLLAARNLDVDDRTRERIRATTDVDMLGRWLGRASICTAVDEIFRDG